MKFPLDSEGRFVLTACESGWDLIVDDETVFYCHHPVEAISYMSEKLREAEVAEGVEQVVDALARIQKQIEKAVEVIKIAEASRVIVPVLMNLDASLSDKRKTHIQDAALSLAGCSLAEFKVRDDRKEIVIKARAILEPWFEIHGVQA